MNFLPGWNSADSASTIAHALHIATFAVLVLLCVAAAMALIYDNRRDHLVSQQQAAANQGLDAKTVQLQRQLTEAQSAAASAQQRADELQRLREPRHLTDEQKDKIVEALRNEPKGHLIVKALVSVPDAIDYSQEIGRFFRDRLGWTVKVGVAMVTGRDTSNMWITIRDHSTVEALAIAFQKAMKNAGLPISNEGETATEPNAPTPNEIWLYVGAKT